MKKLLLNGKTATIVVSLYLGVYTVLHQAGAPMPLLAGMFVLSPFLLIWMVYAILRYTRPPQRELQEGEEWGYGDIHKDKLGTF